MPTVGLGVKQPGNASVPAGFSLQFLTRFTVEQSIGVYGLDVLLWCCLLKQSPTRPQPAAVLQHANYLLDELRRSQATQQISVQAADDGQFAIAALIDEIALAQPDLRQLWSQQALQATRFQTYNAGVDFFERLSRVRSQAPRNVLATYAAVLGIGFQGCYGLPGADRYALAQLQRDLAAQLGVDPDRDWDGGVLKPVRRQDVENLDAFGVSWYKTVAVGRALALLFMIGAIATVGLVLVL